MPAVSSEDKKQMAFRTACPPGAGRGLQPPCPEPFPAAAGVDEPGVHSRGTGKAALGRREGCGGGARAGGGAGLQGAVVPAVPPSPEGAWRLEVARVLWTPSSLVSWWKAQAPVANPFCWK